jgi:hypothetical protein
MNTTQPESNTTVRFFSDESGYGHIYTNPEVYGPTPYISYIERFGD